MIPKTQKQYLELTREEKSKVPTETLIKLLGEDTTGADDKDEDYYPLSEAFEAMSAEERAQMSSEDKLKILEETPQKRNK